MIKRFWKEKLGPWERGLIIAGGVSFVLVAIKFFGIEMPFHQDEWKTARFIVDPNALAGIFHHPPLTELLYRAVGLVLPPELFRLVPLAFTLLSFGLLYPVLEARIGFKAALLSIILLGTSAYGAVAALMLDLDGAIMPFFMLLTVYAYDRAHVKTGNARIFFLALLLTALVLGLLIKLSFIIVVGAILIDYLFERRKDITVRDLLRLFGLLAAFFVFIAFLVLVARFVYPSFSVEAMVAHALTYIHLGNREWGQIAFQTFKALIYTGPLVFFVLFLRRDVFEKTRFFFVYLGLGLMFYLVLFDFSSGALDKYLMFTIVPVCAIAGAALAPYIPYRNLRRIELLVILAGALALVSVNFLPHEVLPLYPKSVWAKDVLSLHWNILIPFMGGSGPIGFYISFLFIALSFAAGSLLALVAVLYKNARTFCAGALLVLVFLQSAVFTEELFSGRINGSTANALHQALAYIDTTPSVASIITYNDTGAFELWQRGRYAGRFYAVPGYEEGHKELFAKHAGHYLVVDMPRLNVDSFYSKFFSTCETTFSSSSGAITARVYYCPHSDPFSIK